MSYVNRCHHPPSTEVHHWAADRACDVGVGKASKTFPNGGMPLGEGFGVSVWMVIGTGRP